MSAQPKLKQGRTLKKIKPPFEFDINGKINISSSATAIEGINEFANHYVSEWLLWYRSGRLDTKVCDIAALIVSAISCKFLQNYSLDHGPNLLISCFYFCAWFFIYN